MRIGLRFVIQLEKLGVNPDVGRVDVHEDGYIAEDPDAASRASLRSSSHCRGKGELQDALLVQRARMLCVNSSRACGSRRRSGSGHSVHAPVLNWRRSTA